jgi:hypothetical protein
MDRTSLYRHFDTHGRLLYVGISKSHLARLAQHQTGASWYWDITRIDVEQFKTRKLALFAEMLAIRYEKPLHNLVRPELSEAELLAQAFRACPVQPSHIQPEGPRCFGYLRTTPQELIRGIQGLRMVGIPDNLVFVDFKGKARGKPPSFIRVLRSAQHDGTKIYCNRPHQFKPVAAILKERGVTVHPAPALA